MRRLYPLSSNATVLLALWLTAVLQTAISFSITFGPFAQFVPDRHAALVRFGWAALRGALLILAVVFWAMRRDEWFFRTVEAANALLTVNLALNVLALVNALFSTTTQNVTALLSDVVLVALANILIFAMWYWIIDPPGIRETKRVDEAWDFLFPQRASPLPRYEDWEPAFTDYVYLAFTTSVAFSPADTLPLTHRAKRLMMLQAAVSVVTIIVVAGTAVNVL